MNVDKTMQEFEIWFNEREKSREAKGWLPLGKFIKIEMYHAFEAATGMRVKS